MISEVWQLASSSGETSSWTRRATSVPGMCRTQIGCAVIVPWWDGNGAGKRCKWLIHKPLELPIAAL